MSARRPPPGTAWRFRYREEPRRGERGPEHVLTSADWPGEGERLRVRTVIECVEIADWFSIERVDGVLLLRCGRHRAVAREDRDGGAVVRMGA
jgi:hypothetical protein